MSSVRLIRGHRGGRSFSWLGMWFAPGVGVACLVAGLGGCSSNHSSGDTVLQGTASAPDNPTVVSPTVPGGPNSPLTLFEQRRLINEIATDPHRLQNLSARERRGLAAMAEATDKKKKVEE